MRPIDADKLKEYISANYSGNIRKNSVLASIDTQPTSVAEEVIRCKNCKYSGEILTPFIKATVPPGSMQCLIHRGENGYWFSASIVSENDFCSQGERKGSNNQVENMTAEEFMRRMDCLLGVHDAKMDGGQKYAID